jgi:hypothetical protein
MLSCLHQFPQVHARPETEDSRQVLFSPSGIGLLLCWGAAAWAKCIVLRISNLGML